MKNEKNVALKEAPKASAKTRRKGGKIVMWIFIVLAGLILLLAVANTICTAVDMHHAKSFSAVKSTNMLKPTLDKETGFYTFTTDRDFKVMQLTDLHIGSAILSVDNDIQAMNEVARMVQVEKPDLVIITGDAIFPVPGSGTFNNRTSCKVFCTLMNSLGVYWCYCFGNHDNQLPSYHSEAYLAQMYENSSEKCLFQRGPSSVDGEGNYAINVKNTDGIITRSYIIMDSHSYTSSDKWGFNNTYDNIHPNQIAWYKSTVRELSAQNQKTIASISDSKKMKEYSDEFSTVKSFVFLHIPLEEYKTAWFNYKNNGYKNTADTKYMYGWCGEEKPYICCGAGHDNMFETAAELGSTQGFFCGHDHTNNFSFNYKGIRLTYSYSIDSLVYKNIKHLGSQRGCTLIYSSADGSWKIQPENYYQKKYDYSGREKVTMQVLNKEQQAAQQTNKNNTAEK